MKVSRISIFSLFATTSCVLLVFYFLEVPSSLTFFKTKQHLLSNHKDFPNSSNSSSNGSNESNDTNGSRQNESSDWQGPSGLNNANNQGNLNIGGILGWVNIGAVPAGSSNNTSNESSEEGQAWNGSVGINEDLNNTDNGSSVGNDTSPSSIEGGILSGPQDANGGGLPLDGILGAHPGVAGVDGLGLGLGRSGPFVNEGGVEGPFGIEGGDLWNDSLNGNGTLNLSSNESFNGSLGLNETSGESIWSEGEWGLGGNWSFDSTNASEGNWTIETNNNSLNESGGVQGDVSSGETGWVNPGDVSGLPPNGNVTGGNGEPFPVDGGLGVGVGIGIGIGGEPGPGLDVGGIIGGVGDNPEGIEGIFGGVPIDEGPFDGDWTFGDDGGLGTEGWLGPIIEGDGDDLALNWDDLVWDILGWTWDDPLIWGNLDGAVVIVFCPDEQIYSYANATANLTVVVGEGESETIYLADSVQTDKNGEFRLKVPKIEDHKKEEYHYRLSIQAHHKKVKNMHKTMKLNESWKWEGDNKIGTMILQFKSKKHDASCSN